MALDDVSQDGDIDVALEQLSAIPGIDALGIRESAFGEVVAEGFLQS